MEDIKMTPEPIALVGSSCRFAGDATSPSKLWKVLANPTDLSRSVPATRFSSAGFFHEDAEHHGTTNSPYGYWLNQDVGKFDAAFFNISKKEAEAMDPQQRLLLEVVYEALESAGYSLKKLGGRNVGVYAGVMTTDYRSLSERDELNASQYAATGNAASIIANRISYFYDFHGPSMTVDTACSASLVALHQAVLGLRSGEAEMACVAGVNLMLTPEQFISESDLHMLSPTGHCRMWDAGADGYARGEGVVAFFIKTLSRALADGDSIQAVIRHTGVNSDGKTQGITMPNPAAQSALIRQTYQRAGLDPRNPDHRPQYFEAHGTGTPAGDPREARAIAEAFFGDIEDSTIKTSDSPQEKLLVGSVKTVIGHTEGAAGLAGILKVVLAMENDSIPRNLHHNSLNPSVLPYYSNLQIPTQTLDWPSPSAGHPMRASVNSFGFGGTNAHAIVEKYRPETHDAGARSAAPRPNGTAIPDPVSVRAQIPDAPRHTGIALPIVISAASEESFVATLEDLVSYIRRNPHVTTQELGWHLYARRTAHSLKAFVVPGPGGASSAIPSLQSLIERSRKASPTQPGTYIRAKKMATSPRILGIFTGQGAQYTAMSRGLLRTSTVYRATIRKLDKILQDDCPDPPEWSLEEKMMMMTTAEGQAEPGVETAAIAQPLCTALQIALVELLASLNVSFHCVVGHSSGEIAAAFAAKRLSMRDAMLVAYYRGRLAHLAAGADGRRGGMVACGMSWHEAEEFCSRPEYRGRICAAASNSPSLVTLSGDMVTITAASDELRAAGRLAKVLKVDTAYHSFHMVRPVQQYSEALARCSVGAHPHLDGTTTTTTTTTWVSSVYGRQGSTGITQEDLATTYWRDNMLSPVLFREAVEVALKDFGPFDCAVEVGPHPQLQTPAMETIKGSIGTDMPYSGLLQRGREADVAFAEFLGFVCVNLGTAAVDMRNFVRQSSQPGLARSPRLVDAPAYAWDHTQSYWRESRLSSQYHSREQPPHELLGVRARDDDQFHMRWRNVLKTEQIPWAEGHRFQGQALLPASAYCVMALDAARAALAGRSASVVELRDLRFLGGITMEPGSLGVETLFTLSILPRQQSRSGHADIIEAGISLTSVAVTSSRPGPMKKNFEGRVLIVLGEPSADALPPPFGGPLAETLPVDVAAFYQMMEGIGLSYNGPFRALSSIDRRLDYARGTLSKAHPLDTTRMDVSPAFLDSCFQATFATFSSPGDKALWTSFLPTRIGRMRFNQGISSTREASAVMTVECHLTKFDHYSFGSPATITADLSISNNLGQTEIQLEELVVSSFSPARPEDDYELYLHTVMGLDPEHEIVTVCQQPEGVRKHIDESCERVAQVYLRQPARTLPVDTPPDSPRSYPDAAVVRQIPAAVEQEMDRFVSRSPYFYALDLLRSPRVVDMSYSQPLEFSLAYRSVVGDAHRVHGFHTHLGRVVGQIAHRFPRMAVLDLTFAEWAFTENVLDGLQGTFSSYRLMASAQPQYLLDRCPGLSTNKKVSFRDVDLDAEVEGMGSLIGAHDLVVVSTAIFSRFSASEADIVQKVRQLMRKRGFLIVVSAPPVSKLEHKFGLGEGVFGRSGPDERVPFDPAKSLQQHTSMFLPAAGNSTQSHPSGFSMTVRQAGDELPVLKDGRSHQESVVIVGPAAASLGLGRLGAGEKFGGQAHLEVFDELEDVTPEAASAATVAMLLMDLTRPVCSSMTDGALGALRSLMQPGKIILWVTRAAQRDPETAASLGLTRTLKAENPDLILQVLDFCSITEQSADVIMDRLVLLVQYRDHIQTAEDLREKMLFSFEPEMHVDGTRQVVPRVLPYRPAIERLNASRREVFRTYNSLETCLVVSSARGTDGVTRFEVRRPEGEGAGATHAAGLPRRQQQPTGRIVNVEYSSLYPFSTGQDDLYVCIGLAADNGLPVAGIAPCVASTVPTLQAFELPEGAVDRKGLASWLAPMVAVFDLATWARPGDMVLVDPDPTFLHCARAVLPLRHRREGFAVHALTTDPRVAREHADVTFVHPLSNSRELKRLIPHARPTVVDFLPAGNGLSEAIRSHAGDYSEYVRWPPSSGVRRDQRPLTEGSVWADVLRSCLMMVGRRLSQAQPSAFVTPALLHGTSGPKPAFTVVDWKSDRHVPVPVRSLVEPRLLRPDRTYLLVGLTRDLGQSLCRLFVLHGARDIVVASRSPNKAAGWISELNSGGANVRARQLDVADLEGVKALGASLPSVGGVVNGAMVLDDRVFAHMDADTWARVMRPKAVGSSNLDQVFGAGEDLDFFIMTSSFAAVGGHAGQSNYAAANMFMNGLAASRRRRGLAGSVLNIGVIYGLGLLARERQDIYRGLEREGYPPVSERDIHHMFLEAIVAGRPAASPGGQVADLTTGLARYRVGDPNPLHWHRDSRFCHLTVDDDDDDDDDGNDGNDGKDGTGPRQDGTSVRNLRELIGSAGSAEAAAGLLCEHLCNHLRGVLQLSAGGVSGDRHIVELGVDSLMAVEIRNWFYKRVGSDVPVMKILQPQCISELCLDVANKIVAERG